MTTSSYSSSSLSFLKEQLGEGMLDRVEGLEGWEPLQRYITSLVGEEGAVAANTSELRFAYWYSPGHHLFHRSYRGKEERW